MQRKLWFVFGVICILFVVLIGRIMYIQYTSGDRYEKIVLGQQKYDSTIIPFQRGNIVDARGTVLATSVDVYNVILDCKVLNENESNAKKQEKDSVITPTVNLVAECFPEIDKEKIRTQLEEHPKSQYFILAKKVPYEEMAAFQEKRNLMNTKIRYMAFGSRKNTFVSIHTEALLLPLLAMPAAVM